MSNIFCLSLFFWHKLQKLYFFFFCQFTNNFGKLPSNYIIQMSNCSFLSFFLLLICLLKFILKVSNHISKISSRFILLLNWFFRERWLFFILFHFINHLFRSIVDNFVYFCYNMPMINFLLSLKSKYLNPEEVSIFIHFKSQHKSILLATDLLKRSISTKNN